MTWTRFATALAGLGAAILLALPAQARADDCYHHDRPSYGYRHGRPARWYDPYGWRRDTWRYETRGSWQWDAYSGRWVWVRSAPTYQPYAY